MKLNLGQKLGLTAAGLFPAMWLLSGLVLWLIGSAVPTVSYVLAYLLLPGLCLVLLTWIVRRSWRSIWRAIACLALLVVTLFFGSQLMLWGHFSLHDCTTGADGLEYYEEDIGSTSVNMPEPTELGQPERIEYHYFYNQIALFFDSDCYTLICTYSPGDYAEMTAALDERYTFHTEPLNAGETELEPLYALKGYRFRFLEMGTDRYHLNYPHSMILIGTNDATREIVWSYYSDDDLDYIPSPEEFLLEDCGWKYIR